MCRAFSIPWSPALKHLFNMFYDPQDSFPYEQGKAKAATALKLMTLNNKIRKETLYTRRCYEVAITGIKTGYIGSKVKLLSAPPIPPPHFSLSLLLINIASQWIVCVCGVLILT